MTMFHKTIFNRLLSIPFIFILMILLLSGCSKTVDDYEKATEGATIVIEEFEESVETVPETETSAIAEEIETEGYGSEVKASEVAAIEALEDLKRELINMIDSYDGEWAIYVYNLETDEYLDINSHPMKSASVIKLFIMAALYEQVDHGELELTNNIETLMKQMITVSHNESSNELVRLLSPTRDNHEDGMKVVNQYAEKYGYKDTNQGRDMLDYREVPAKGENYTSVEDTALLLREIYRGTCVSEEYSRVMLNLLKQQERTWKIPAGLPQGVKSANKTGELPDTENDAAIVFGETTDYILCVMSQGLTNTSQAQSNIQNISGVVYKYFN